MLGARQRQEPEEKDGHQQEERVRAASSTSTDSFLDGSDSFSPAVPRRGAATAPSAPAPAPAPAIVVATALAKGSSSPDRTPHVPFNFCVECEDQSAEVSCLDCQEDFCRPCFSSQHRRGKRAEHRLQPILGEMMAAPEVTESTEGTTGMVIVQQAVGGEGEGEGEGERQEGEGKGDGKEEKDAEGIGGSVLRATQGFDEDEDAYTNMAIDDLNASHTKNGASAGDVSDVTPGATAASSSTAGLESDAHFMAEYETLKSRANEHFTDRYLRTYHERAKTTPMRLTPQERQLLSVLESALNVSEYTDNVDTVSRRAKSVRIIEELEHLFATILGLMICSEPIKGVDLVRKEVAENGAFFQNIFEVGRRYKIMNPDKMRNTYGKLMYMLQDTQSRTIQPQVGFCCVKEIVTVWSFLEERGALALLEDGRTLIASRDITDKNGRKTREEVAMDVGMKRLAAKELKAAFASADLTAEDIQRVLDSIADSNNYLTFNVLPVRKMIKHLTDNFAADEIEQGFSLAIGGGGGSRYSYKPRSSSGFSMYGGGYGSSYFKTDSAKLSHDHGTHFTYVWQSLRLWREIMSKMFCLWYRADQDLLSSTSTYQLLNTGQGLNRVQVCPKVGNEMRSILNTVQRECGSWVGLSVVHLGDRDVPNALMFIDKYTQVPRILAPIARVIEQCNGLFENEALKSYAEDVWDDPDNLKMHVLVDFFKHAFDGDGDDGGSCIDGRLTSAWNWCSKIAKKPYYHAFLLAGFSSFNGDWKD